VTATGFNYSRNTNFAQVSRNPGQPGGQSSENLQLNLTIAVEPRLPIIKVGRVTVTAAEDDDKCSMLCIGNASNFPWEWDYYDRGQRRSFFQQTSVNLSWPSKNSRTVGVVRGIIPVTLLAEERATVVTDNILAAKGKKFKVGSSSFSIDDVSKSGAQYQIKIDYSDSGNENPYDYSRLQAIPQRMELQDDKGNKYSTYMRTMSYNSPSSATFQLGTNAQAKNSKLGPPAKLIFQQWIQMEHEVHFEFRNLPLP
jgi:hypothetical protein